MSGPSASEPVTGSALADTSTPVIFAEGNRGIRQLQLLIVAVMLWTIAYFVIPPLEVGVLTIAFFGATAALIIAGVVVTTRGVDEGLRFSVIHGSIPFWLGVMWYSLIQLPPRGQFAVAFLGGILLLYILSQLAEPIRSRAYGELGLLGGSAIVTIVTTAYITIDYQRIAVYSLGRATPPELVLGVLFTAAIIYLTWRSFGVTFLVVVFAGIGYGLFGQFIPGTLGHGGLAVPRTIRILVMSADGFFGFLTRLVAAWIALFLLYAGLLKAYGAFDLILRLAVRSARYVDSGIAQTAVIASAVIGSVNGSQTANAGMTGSFTIPLMKENGIKPETAGGIEAVASTAGQVLPPVMGAGAFIMASLVTGITYVDVIVAGLIPAAILVVSIVIAVHYVSVPQIDDPQMEGMVDERLDRSTFVLELVKYGVPLVLLIYILGVLQYTVMTAALWTAVSMIAFGITIPVIQTAIGGGSYTASLRQSFTQTIDGAREGALVLAPVAIILAAINGVVDILMATGVPTAISLALMDLSGGVMLIAVILAMIICIILGLGMPTTAAYTVVALLIAPTLINQFLIPDLASHFFVFYAAILAGLTPPIATCVAVTCGISGGGFWASAREALVISAPLFILPFTFVYHPEIVSGRFDTTALTAGAIAMVAAIVIIHGINHRSKLRRSMTLSLRFVFVGLGIVAMVHPDVVTQLGALAVVGVLLLFQFASGRRLPISLRQIRGRTEG